MDELRTFTVTDFITLLNIGLKRSKARVLGEITEAKKGPTGHMYFSIKDEKESVLNCIMWRSSYYFSGTEIKEGAKIIISGSPQVYPLSGRLSFIAETIEPAGEGEIRKRYEELKKKLEKEGVFSDKRPIPKYIQKIGIITSMKGAVLADFSNNLKKFGFCVKIADSRVEGQEAVKDLLRSIRTFERQDIEVLVIMRGGGSMESMMAFNNEIVARSIAEFPKPVIAAIGHHKDEPLSALASDISVSTPTAAANLLNESWLSALLAIERYERSILSNFEETIDSAKSILRNSAEKALLVKDLISKRVEFLKNKIQVLFQKYKNAILNKRLYLGKLFEELNFKDILAQAAERIKSYEKITIMSNPERQLGIGYSIAFLGGKVLKSVKDVNIEDMVDIKMADGALKTKVNNIKYGE